MNLAMLPEERTLLEGLLCCSRTYLEFGAGGSTHLACGLVSDRVMSVDSSRTWLDAVKAACGSTRLQPGLVLADIGPVGEWGYPTDASLRDRWPSYSQGVWQTSAPAEADLCLVDGRFRVACALSCLLHTSQHAFTAVHDYAGREKYHVIGRYADEVARTRSLSVFRRRRAVSDRLITAELDEWLFDPD